MRVEKRVLCRGGGKAFLLLGIHHAQGIGDNFSLEITAHTKKSSCPLEWFDACSLNTEGIKEIICVIPQTRCDQVIRFEIISETRTIIDSYEMSVRAMQSAFESKYYGRAKQDDCKLIRNIDFVRNADSRDLKVDSLVFSRDNTWLMHFSIALEGEEGTELQAYCWTDSIIAGLKVQILEPRVVNGEYPRAHFSVLFNQGVARLVIGVQNKGDGSWLAFDAFEQGVLKRMFKAYEQRYQGAHFDPFYGLWFKNHRATHHELQMQTKYKFEKGPCFSIVVPLYETPLPFFIEMVESVIRQTYEKWELLLVNASPENEKLFRLAADYAARFEKIEHIVLMGNLGITENTNVGIDHAKGDYLCFFDHDDVLEPNILFEYASAIESDPEIGLLYCDEDKLLPNGTVGEPTFKPSFNLDLLRDNNYICHLLTVKKSIHDQFERASADVDGAQDYSLTLKAAEAGVEFCHIPKILYHWRVSKTSTSGNSNSKPYATQAGVRALQAHLDRSGLHAQAENAHERDYRYKVNYSMKDEGVSLLLIPRSFDVCSRKHITQLEDDLLYLKHEIVIATVEDDVDATLLDGPAMKTCKVPDDASFATKIKIGLESCSFDQVIVVVGDVCFDQRDWASVLLGHLQREEVGIVSPMICDVAGVVRSAGMTYLPTTLVPLSQNIYKESFGYLYRPLSTQDVSLVNPDCFAIKKNCFEMNASFSEKFSAECFIADYCFRLAERGLLAVYTPEALVYQFSEDRKQEPVDASFLQKWHEKLLENDPYFNPNFSSDPFRASQYCLGEIDL